MHQVISARAARVGGLLVSVLLCGAAFAPVFAQSASPALEDRAFQLGVEAASRARVDQANAEAVIAERYRQTLDLSPDPAVQPRLKDAFQRGYRSAIAGGSASAPTSTSAAGAVYVHPSAGYQIAPPPGWSVNDKVPTADVQMRAADGNGLVEITSGPVSTRLDPVSYAAGWESVAVGPGQRLRAKRAGRETTLGGEMAYEGVYEGDGVLVKVLFVGVPERFWVITGVFPAGEFARVEPVFDAMTRTFRPKR